MLGFYGDNGKYNGNYYSGFSLDFDCAQQLADLAKNVPQGSEQRQRAHCVAQVLRRSFLENRRPT